MSTATVKLSDRQSIALDTLQGTTKTTKGVLLTIEGSGTGQAQNCAVIPEDRLGDVIATLQMVQKQLRGEGGVRCIDPAACMAGQRECPTKGFCGIAP